MPIDPNIALQATPTLPDFGQSIQTANNLLALRQNQQQAQRDNALRNALAQPGAFDATGNLTPDALQRVTAIDPQAGIKLRQNMLVQQEHGLRMEGLKSDLFQKKMDMIGDFYAPIYETYQQRVKEVGAEQAAQEAQRALSEANEQMTRGGVFSPDELKRQPTKFDPVQMGATVAGTKQYQDWLKGQQSQNREAYPDSPEMVAYTGDNGQPTQEMARYNRDRGVYESLATGQPIKAKNLHTVQKDDAGWTVMQDWTRLDQNGSPTPYRYNPRIPNSATTLDGQPYSPGGASRVGTQPAGAPMNQSPEAKASGYAQAATGMPINQIAPGYGRETARVREDLREGAIKKIMADEGVDATQAGIILARRTIEFQSGKKSSGQITEMLGATRVAVSQLDFNIKKATEEMGKLSSSDLSPIFNAIIRGEEKWTGDPAYASTFFYLQAAATESARIMAGGQASRAQLQEGARKAAEQWANMNMTPSSWASVSQAMLDEGRNRIENYTEALKSQQVGGSVKSGTDKPDPAGTTPAPAPDGGGAKAGPAPAANGYTGDTPPSGFPNARKSPKDGFWYIPRPGGGYQRLEVVGAASSTAQPAATPEKPAPEKPAPEKPAPEKPAPKADTQAAAPDGKTQATPIPVKSPADVEKIKPGMWFLPPDGIPRLRTATRQPSAPTD